MRILSATSWTWFGGLSAVVVGLLSLSATNAQDGVPEGTVDRLDTRSVAAAFASGGVVSPRHGGDEGNARRGRWEEVGPRSQEAREGTGDKALADAVDRAGNFSLPLPVRLPATGFGEVPDRDIAAPPSPAEGVGSSSARLSVNSGSGAASSTYYLFSTGGGGGLPGFPGGGSGGSGRTATGSSSSGGSSSFVYYIYGNGGYPYGAGNGGSGSGFLYFGSVDAAPEPSSWALGFLAMGAVIYLRRRALRS